jgi:hypothetical protein
VSWLSLVSVGLPTTGSVSLKCLALQGRFRLPSLKIIACIETHEVMAQISAPEGPCARGPPPQRGDEEATLSHIYAGQHFRSDENAGERLGSAVADFIVDNLLTRVHRRDGEGDKERSDN